MTARALRHLVGYIGAHWQGRHSVGRTLLLNTGVVDATLLGLQEAIAPGRLLASHRAGLAVFGLLALACAALWIWQLVGSFRAASRPEVLSGSASSPYLALAVSLLSLFALGHVLIDVGFDRMPGVPGDPPIDPRSGDVPALAFMAPDTLVFEGSIDFGATAEFDQALVDHPGVRRLILDSPGGVVVEARGMANSVGRRGLSTHVEHRCYSACTLVYIAGYPRSIALSGRLGFHRYLQRTSPVYPGLDPDIEQHKDAARFASRDVHAWFIERMFDEPHDSLWMPSRGELFESGIVTVEAAGAGSAGD